MGTKHAHFKDKEAIDHVVEAQVQGIFDSTETHGTEIPGHLSAASDAAKETSIILVLVWAALIKTSPLSPKNYTILAIIALAWLVWKCGRSAWLGWSRLERLHRVVEQEKWEIDHHRSQERDELKALYSAKGFEGKLLDDVVDVLMADGDRLLRVMVEEELGLSLESHEHPIKQAIGAMFGTIFSALICATGLYLYPSWGIIIAGLIVIGCAAGFSSRYEHNRLIPAVVWNLGLGVLAYGTVYYLIEYAFA